MAKINADAIRQAIFELEAKYAEHEDVQKVYEDLGLEDYNEFMDVAIQRAMQINNELAESNVDWAAIVTQVWIDGWAAGKQTRHDDVVI